MEFLKFLTIFLNIFLNILNIFKRLNKFIMNKIKTLIKNQNSYFLNKISEAYYEFISE